MEGLRQNRTLGNLPHRSLNHTKERNRARVDKATDDVAKCVVDLIFAFISSVNILKYSSEKRVETRTRHSTTLSKFLINLLLFLLSLASQNFWFDFFPSFDTLIRRRFFSAGNNSARLSVCQFKFFIWQDCDDDFWSTKSGNTKKGEN